MKFLDISISLRILVHVESSLLTATGRATTHHEVSKVVGLLEEIYNIAKTVYCGLCPAVPPDDRFLVLSDSTCKHRLHGDGGDDGRLTRACSLTGLRLSG